MHFFFQSFENIPHRNLEPHRIWEAWKSWRYFSSLPKNRENRDFKEIWMFKALRSSQWSNSGLSRTITQPRKPWFRWLPRSDKAPWCRLQASKISLKSRFFRFFGWFEKYPQLFRASQPRRMVCFQSIFAVRFHYIFFLCMIPNGSYPKFNFRFLRGVLHRNIDNM